MSESYSKSISDVKIMEKKLLNIEQYNRMIEAHSPEEALKVLSQSDYNVDGLTSSKDYELALSQSLKKMYDDLYAIAPDTQVIDIMSLKYDFNNLKLIAKNKFLKIENIEKQFLNYTKTDALIIKEAVDTNSGKDLPPSFRDILEYVIKIYEENEDPQLLDISLDKSLFYFMRKKCDAVGNDFIINFVKQSIDVQNFKIYMRLKIMGKNSKFLEQALVDGGKIDKSTFVKSFDGARDFDDFMGSLSSKFMYKDFSKSVNLIADDYARDKNLMNIEKYFDNYLMNIVKDAKFKFFGPESLISYMFAKEIEIKNIRTIMVGKISSVSAEALKERLRDTYV